MQLAIALAILVLSIMAFRFALPVDGKVRPYLRSDTAQAYYTVLLVFGLVFGLLFSVVSVTRFFL